MQTFAHKQSLKKASTRRPLAFAETPFPMANGLSFNTPRHASVQSKPLCPCGGGCPRCNRVIQAKLKIGQPDDVYEQEADRIADRVMRMPEPTVRAKPT